MEFWFSLDNPERTPEWSAEDVSSALGGTEPCFLGRGTYGETWRLTRNGTVVAAKIIHNRQATNARVEREPEAVRRVSGSARIAQLLSCERVAIGASSYPCLVFEYVNGGSLASHLLRGHWPGTNEVLAFAKGMLEGLATIHESNVVHRDIKPENIALKDQSYHQPAILDFGIARILDIPSLTVYPTPTGTVPYMAPEQIRGDRAHKGTDLWALGIILYLLVSRRHPFFSDYEHRLDDEDALDRVLAGPPNLPSETPDLLAELILRFLQPQPFQRGSARRALRHIGGLVHD